jgi:hypothetical protein
MMDVGLLQKAFFCIQCNKEFCLKETNVTADGFRWKCSGKLCNKTSISIRKNSFFSNSKLPLQTLVLISYDWSRNVSVKEVAHEYNITKKSVIDWFRFIRDVCIEKMILLNLGAKIGGPNLVVEVDETCVSRRKNNVGRVTPTVWMIGGITRSERFEMFLEIVENRSASVLEDVICRNVEIGTTIITDKWRGYLNLNNCGYIHKTINHSRNFVDPDDPEVHTQRIESRWNAFKRFLRTKGTNKKQNNGEYMIEYMYRKKFPLTFESLINDISLQYPFN